MYKLLTYSEKYSLLLQDIISNEGKEFEVTKLLKGKLSWFVFKPQKSILPNQGWKIHISFQALDYQNILEIVKYLIFSKVHFKVPGDLETICYINSGDAGTPQTGKIITIYPLGSQLIKLVNLLNDKIHSSNGPMPPSDLILKKNTAISLRFGVFQNDVICYNNNDLPKHGLIKPDGTIVPDERKLNSSFPEWIEKPKLDFLPSNVKTDHLPIDGILRLALIQKRNHSKVFLCIDTKTGKTVITKEVRLRTGLDLNGFDGKDRILNEFFVLNKLSKISSIVPKPLKKIQDEDKILIVLEDLKGKNLAEVGKNIQLKYLKKFIKAIIKLHSLGFVHRDIKLSNAVIVNNKVKLIDFEMACPPDKDLFILGGTKNYVPVEGMYAKPEFKYDSFSIGTCLLHIALGKDPSLLPIDHRQRLGLLYHLGYSKLADLVKKTYEVDLKKRLSVQEILSELSKLKNEDFICQQRITIDFKDTRWFDKAIYSASVATRKYKINHDNFTYWKNTHTVSDFICEGLNIGAAGIVVGLITISQILKKKYLFLDDIKRGAAWLSKKKNQNIPNGLFTGKTGIALTLGLVSKFTSSSEYLEESKCFLKAACKKIDKTDFFSGTAGAIYAGCVLFELFDDRDFLEIVNEPVKKLISSVFKYKNNSTIFWPSNLNIPISEQSPSVGIAHGATGIAFSLGMYGKHTNSDDLINLTTITLKSIYEFSKNEEGDSLLIDAKSREIANNNIWCHGVGGYLWSIIQLYDFIPELEDELKWSADLFFKSSIIDNPTYCHGISGQIETCRLLKNIPIYEYYAKTRLQMLKRVLRNYHLKRDNNIVWASEDFNTITPDLWVGFLAPATALALAKIDSGQTLLSLKWYDETK